MTQSAYSIGQLFQSIGRLDKPLHYLVYRPYLWDKPQNVGIYPQAPEAIVRFYARENHWRKECGTLLAQGESVRAGVTTLRKMLEIATGEKP